MGHRPSLTTSSGRGRSVGACRAVDRGAVDEGGRLEIDRRLSHTMLRSHQGQALDLAIDVTELPQRRHVQRDRAQVDLHGLLDEGDEQHDARPPRPLQTAEEEHHQPLVLADDANAEQGTGQGDQAVRPLRDEIQVLAEGLTAEIPPDDKEGVTRVRRALRVPLVAVPPAASVSAPAAASRKVAPPPPARPKADPPPATVPSTDIRLQR